jgi:hypothetical protein
VTLTASRESVEAEPADVKQNSAPAHDLSGKAGEIVNFLKELLPDTKLPKKTISELRKFLETMED